MKLGEKCDNCGLCVKREHGIKHEATGKTHYSIRVLEFCLE